MKRAEAFGLAALKRWAGNMPIFYNREVIRSGLEVRCGTTKISAYSTPACTNS